MPPSWVEEEKKIILNISLSLSLTRGRKKLHLSLSLYLSLSISLWLEKEKNYLTSLSLFLYLFLSTCLSFFGSFFKDERRSRWKFRKAVFARISHNLKKKKKRTRSELENHFVAVRLSNLLHYSRRENSNKLCRVAAERGVPVKQACGLSTSSVVAERLSCFATVTKWIIRGEEGGRGAGERANGPHARFSLTKIYTVRLRDRLVVR